MRKKLQFGLILLLAAMFAAGAVFLFVKIRKPAAPSGYDGQTAADYVGVFLSTYDISNFSEEDFAVYRGLPIQKLDTPIRSAKELDAALNNILSGQNSFTNIYLGLDPTALYSLNDANPSKLRELCEEGWLSCVDAHPDITFEVLYVFPSMEYWLDLKKEDREKTLLLYRYLTEVLTARSNLSVFYTGGQEWLICNPANYTEDGATNRVVSQKLFLLTFCDHMLEITADNAPAMLEHTASLIQRYEEFPVSYPDLSQYDIVFLGDSIFGNYQGSISIPGVVNGLSGAACYNCGWGSISAAEASPGAVCFPKMAEIFVSGQPEIPDNPFGQSVLEYASANHTGKNTCFLINYGLNDYFDGYAPSNPEDPYDITTYAGALRTGIRILKEKYPEAAYVIMGPGKTTYFSDGTEQNGESGGVMEDYYNLARLVAKETDCSYIDLYRDFPEGDDTLLDVLADGCHYSEYGRFAVGRKITLFLSLLCN